MQRAWRSAWRRICALSPIEQDALLYLWAALFAAPTAVVATSSDYRSWAEIALVCYVGAAIACGVCIWVRKHGAISLSGLSIMRRIIVGALLFGVVLAPLGAELAWRAEASPGAHAQPEVSVIERAGDRVAHGHDPYLTSPTEVGFSPSSDATTDNANSYFPYLPGMVPFGLLNALGGDSALGDARIVLVGFTLLVAAIALSLSLASTARRGRVLQILVVLPTGALALVTGGDDLPVLALLLLGVVLVKRRQPVAAGLVLGLAATLKLTAWPLAVLVGAVVRDRRDARATGAYTIAAACVCVPVIAVAVALSPQAFFENVVRFPLGLSHIHSPAASPLLGQVLVTFFPGHRKLITMVLLTVGLVIAAWAYVRHRPRDVVGVVRYCAFALVLATLLAPATRFGYLIYPANFLAWAYLLEDGGDVPLGEKGRTQFSSSTSKIRSSRVLVTAPSGAESVGVAEGAGGLIVTPTSQ